MSNFTDITGTTITATSFVGPLTGDAATATLAANATNVTDKLVTATFTVGAGTGNNKPLAVTVKRSDGSTAITTARTVLVKAIASADVGNPLAAGVSTVTFGTATVGSIVVSGAGWAVVTTSAAGAFACTVTDSADETLHMYIETAPGVVATAASCVVMPGVYVEVTWA